MKEQSEEATILAVRHVYEHDPREFEERLAEALAQIVELGGMVGDIKYGIDMSTERNKRGGFGALIIYEAPKPSNAP
jgi:hypothetical protein